MSIFFVIHLETSIMITNDVSLFVMDEKQRNAPDAHAKGPASGSPVGRSFRTSSPHYSIDK